MARKKTSSLDLETEFQVLDQRVSEDLAVPSLREHPPRVQSYAYRFFLVLPLYTGDGKTVFTGEHLGQLHLLFNARCGGWLASSSRSGAPHFGEYLPEGARQFQLL